MAGQAPAAGDAKTSPLQDKKVQIGLGVAALVIVIGAVVGVMMMSRGGGTDTASSTTTPPAATGAAAPPGGGSTAPTGMGATGMGAPGMGSPGMGAPGMGAPGATPAPSTAGTAAAGENRPPRGPGVPTRRNAFVQNDELKRVIQSIPPAPNAPTEYASAHDLFLELNPPEPDVQVVDEGADQGPPIPPMRVSGVVLGNVVSAVLQIGDGNNAQFINVVPGKMIPEGNPVYRVASIENGTVTLVRRWEEGNRKGVQRIEVTLSGSRGGGPSLMGGGPAAGDFN